MAGATTDIEIQSAAAILLGKKPFATIDAADEFAVSLQTFYDQMVPAILSSPEWNFSTKYVQLSESATEDPDFAEWETAYALPGDFLAFKRLYPEVPHQRFNDYIYTSTSGELKLEYVYSTPVTKWTDPFKQYITYALAAALSASNAESGQLARYFEEKANYWKIQAMWLDAQGSTSRGIQRRPWVDARRICAYRRAAPTTNGY